MSLLAAAPAYAQTDNFWQNNYYNNWFVSNATCNSWGAQITNPSSSNYIPGALNWACHLGSGGVKYSMNVLFET